MKKQKKDTELFSGNMAWLIGLVAVLILFNQIQLFQLSTLMGDKPLSLGSITRSLSLHSGSDLKNVDVSTIKSTPQAVAATFDLSGSKTAQEVIDTMIPHGTPDYGKELGISYDDPLKALQFLSNQLYPAIKQDVKQKYPDLWKRYLNLATKPVGISCEYCCGVGPVSITAQGELTCGCSHNPAIHALTLYLMQNTTMNDAEVLREVLRWKSLWFPKNMVEVGLKIAGGDASVLKDVPTMVGGC